MKFGSLFSGIEAASAAWLPGWSLTYRDQTRKETVLPAKTFRVLRVRAVSDDGGEESAA